MASTPERQAEQSDLPVYQVVATRRTQWDVLLWQVPVLSLTAQAFLLTIALGPDTSRSSRLLTSGLGVVTALLSSHLFIRQRQAELTDAKWLAEYDLQHFGITVVHGDGWKMERNKTKIRGCPGFFAQCPAFPIWLAALALFGLIAFAAFFLAVFDTRIFH